MKMYLVSLNDDMYDAIKERADSINNSMAYVVRECLKRMDAIELNPKLDIKIRRWNGEEWADRVKNRDNYVCRECDEQCTRMTTEAHHILPKKKGGKNTLDNGITLCKSCHKNIHIGMKKYKQI